MSNSSFKDFSEISVMGYRLNPMSEANIFEWLQENITDRRRKILCNLNLHGMSLMFDSPAMTKLLSLDESRVMIDSMPVIFICRLAGYALSKNHRTTSLDFYDAMFTLCQNKGWSIDYVGSTPEVLTEGLSILRSRFPALDIDGRDGYFDVSDWSSSSKQSDIMSWLSSRNSDILIVGMGMPRQEEWLYSIKDKIPHRILIPVGAYLEYQTGSLLLPPRWLGPLGLEWAYRLFTTPRRLAYRYLIEPFQLFYRLLFLKHPQAEYWKARRNTVSDDS